MASSIATEEFESSGFDSNSGSGSGSGSGPSMVAGSGGDAPFIAVPIKVITCPEGISKLIKN